MSDLVVDASIALAWLFDDEDQPATDRALDRLKEDGAEVPQLWHLEIRNSLSAAEGRGRMSVDETNDASETRENSLARPYVRGRDP